MPNNTDFAARVNEVQELPETFRAPLMKIIRPDERIRCLIYNPPFQSLSSRSPATVLSVSDGRWMLAVEEVTGVVRIHECEFGDTLLVELTKVLLHSQLKIDFVRAGKTHTVAVDFNTVMMRLYRPALELILKGVEGQIMASDASLDCTSIIAEWPIKFRNVVADNIPEGHKAHAAVYWPAIYSGFNRELAPAGALLLTESEIIHFSEEMSRWWNLSHDAIKFGIVATYFPLSRFADYDITPHSRLDILALQAHTHHGTEKLEIMFAPERIENVKQLMQQAIINDP